MDTVLYSPGTPEEASAKEAEAAERAIARVIALADLAEAGKIPVTSTQGMDRDAFLAFLARGNLKI